MATPARSPFWLKANFWLRTLVSLVGGIALAIVLIVGGWIYDCFIALLMTALIYEWCRLTRIKVESLAGLGLIGFLVLCFVLGMCHILPYYNVMILLSGLLLLIILYFFVPIAEKAPYFWSGFGLLYLGLPLIALIFIGNIQTTHNFLPILWLFSVVWACDISAYLVGSVVGGPKLWPRISPNKTWSGLIGGMIGSGITSSIWAVFYPQHAIWTYFTLGVIMAVLAQAGDLLESKLKRHFGVKDSGNLIPGHGGVMDRFDGLLFVSPFVALYFYYVV